MEKTSPTSGKDRVHELLLSWQDKGARPTWEVLVTTALFIWESPSNEPQAWRRVVVSQAGFTGACVVWQGWLNGTLMAFAPWVLLILLCFATMLTVNLIVTIIGPLGK